MDVLRINANISSKVQYILIYTYTYSWKYNINGITHSKNGAEQHDQDNNRKKIPRKRGSLILPQRQPAYTNGLL